MIKTLLGIHYIFFILDSCVQNILDFTVIDSADRFWLGYFGVHDDCTHAKAKNGIWHCNYTKSTLVLHAQYVSEYFGHQYD